MNHASWAWSASLYHDQKLMLIKRQNVIQIKWICPTAPTRPVAAFGGFPCTACKSHF